MTLGDAATVDADQRARAFGYGQRRSWIFWAWWYGVVMAITGSADAGFSALFGQDAERGIFMVVLGASASALGWLLTLGVRFSRKLPKPSGDIPRVEQAIRINSGVVKFLLVATVLIVAALVLLTPKGASPETLPVTALIAASILSLTGGIAYSGWLMKNSGELYAQRLARRR